MKLSTLIADLQGVNIKGEFEGVEISNIAYDSRKVEPGSLFVCIEGFKVDGHNFIDAAVEKGAVAIVVTKDIDVPGVTIIKHNDTRKALAQIACRFYGNPSSKLNVIGVTGTKGKTTTTFMIKSILEQSDHKVGLIGTIANLIGDKILPAQRTTPESLELQQFFCEMLQNGIDTIVMEVSSHSLDLKRVDNTEFDVGVFTNLSQDHLDYHVTFENYFAAKTKLFDMCKQGIINVDDNYGKRLLEKGCDKLSFGIDNKADINAERIEISPNGTRFNVVDNDKIFEVFVPIPGRFSVYNALAAISACKKFDISAAQIVEGLKKLKVPGRAETVETNRDFAVMVDYAHSPDSLENILNAVKIYAKGRVVSVFGCGGDRDRTKRPIMGEISGRLADFTIITSDNPRTEDPEKILIDVEEGIKKTRGKYTVITDRRAAINYAIKNAIKDDIIVIAGKGHETYQIFKDETIHFDDREVAREAIDNL